MKKKILTPNNIYIIIILLLIILIVSCYKCREYFTEYLTNKSILTLKIKDAISGESNLYKDILTKAIKEYTEYVKLKTNSTTLNVTFKTVIDSNLIKPTFEFTDMNGIVTKHMYNSNQAVDKIVELLKQKVNI